MPSDAQSGEEVGRVFTGENAELERYWFLGGYAAGLISLGTVYHWPSIPGIPPVAAIALGGVLAIAAITHKKTHGY